MNWIQLITIVLCTLVLSFNTSCSRTAKGTDINIVDVYNSTIYIDCDKAEVDYAAGKVVDVKPDVELPTTLLP